MKVVLYMIQTLLKPLLEEKNMTMTELHKRTGISMKTLSLFANQRTDAVQFNTLERIAETLNVEIHDLFIKVDDIYYITVEIAHFEQTKSKYLYDLILSFKHKDTNLSHDLSLSCDVKLTKLNKLKLLTVNINKVNRDDWRNIVNTLLLKNLTTEIFLEITAHAIVEEIVHDYFYDKVEMYDQVYFSWRETPLLPTFHLELVNNQLLDNLNEKIIFPKTSYLIDLVPRDPFRVLRPEEDNSNVIVSANLESLRTFPYLYSIDYLKENNWKRQISITLI